MANHTEEQRIAALAALEVNRGQIRLTARETGVSESTLRYWRSQVETVARVVVAPTPAELDRAAAAQSARAVAQQTAYSDRLAEAMRLALETLIQRIPGMSGRDIAITVGILTDKHLDITLGRKGAQIIADNRSVNLTLPEGTTIDDIRSLRDQLRAGLESAEI